MVFDLAGKAGRFIMEKIPSLISNDLNSWYKQREMPAPPEESFREWYSKNGKESKSQNNG
jgi:L-lactate dehydrogenase complex protein LldF